MNARPKRRGRQSLRFRFFSAVAFAAAVFIGVMLVLNVLFFHSFYLLQKKNSLVHAYNSINEQYNGDISILEDNLKQMENNNNIRISILNNYNITGRRKHSCSQSCTFAHIALMIQYFVW